MVGKCGAGKELTLGSMWKEEQNENDLILSKQAWGHWVAAVFRLLGERRAGSLYFQVPLASSDSSSTD